MAKDHNLELSFGEEVTGEHVGGRVESAGLLSAMLEQWRRRHGGTDISLVLGDFTEVPACRVFDLIYIVVEPALQRPFSRRATQVLRLVAAHPASGGVFFVEVYVPAYLLGLPKRLESERRSHRNNHRGAALTETRRPNTDRRGKLPVALAGDIRVTPVVQRFPWTSELDLFAGVAD